MLADTRRSGGTRLDGGAACYQVYQTADGRFVTPGALEEASAAELLGAWGVD